MANDGGGGKAGDGEAEGDAAAPEQHGTEVAQENAAPPDGHDENEGARLLDEGAALIEKAFADAQKKLPRIYERFREAGMTGNNLRLRMLQLAEMEIEEELLIRAIFEDGPRPEDSLALVQSPSREPARQRLEIIKHSIVRWYRRHGLLKRLAYLLGWAAALLGPTIHYGGTWIGFVGVAIVAVVRLVAAWRDFDPKHIPILEENHEQRQLSLEGLLHTLQQWMREKPTKREIAQYQRRVLELINSYVRDHRSDMKQRKIFTNLLVQKGASVMVLARSEYNRKVPEFYTPDEVSFAWQALQTGEAQVTGNVYGDAPTTRVGKRYASILVLPVKFEHETVGVVSIDSEAKYHFDNVFHALQNELGPYVQLLAITLAADHPVPRNKDQDDGGQTADS